MGRMTFVYEWPLVATPMLKGNYGKNIMVYVDEP